MVGLSIVGTQTNSIDNNFLIFQHYMNVCLISGTSDMIFGGSDSSSTSKGPNSVITGNYFNKNITN